MKKIKAFNPQVEPTTIDEFKKAIAQLHYGIKQQKPLLTSRKPWLLAKIHSIYGQRNKHFRV